MGTHKWCLLLFRPICILKSADTLLICLQWLSKSQISTLSFCSSQKHREVELGYVRSQSGISSDFDNDTRKPSCGTKGLPLDCHELLSHLSQWHSCHELCRALKTLLEHHRTRLFDQTTLLKCRCQWKPRSLSHQKGAGIPRHQQGPHRQLLLASYYPKSWK